LEAGCFVKDKEQVESREESRHTEIAGFEGTRGATDIEEIGSVEAFAITTGNSFAVEKLGYDDWTENGERQAGFSCMLTCLVASSLQRHLVHTYWARENFWSLIS
jgi:hypothetical protein